MICYNKREKSFNQRVLTHIINDIIYSIILFMNIKTQSTCQYQNNNLIIFHISRQNRRLSMKSTVNFKTRKEYRNYLNEQLDRNPMMAMVVNKFRFGEDDEEDISSFIQNDEFSEKEFLEIIAALRMPAYNKTSGGANRAAEKETDRLYAKNPYKFIEEFLQNADDCNYSSIPQLNITIDERDKQRCSVEFCYNENGFSKDDIWAITAFSESTKVNDLVENQKEKRKSSNHTCDP